jgi:hypothetical protein
MSPAFTVTATTGAEEAGGVALAIASLPATFGHAADKAGVADVAAIAGEAGWTGEALHAIESGHRAILVANPCPEDTARLAAAADAAGTAVVLDHRWASNPALVSTGAGPDAREAFRSALGTAAMLDSVAAAAPGSDPGRFLGEHLAALLMVTGPLDGLSLVRSGASGYLISARLPNGAPLTAQGVLTAALPAGVDIRLYTSDGGASVRVPDPGAAWPAEVRATGPHGDLRLPTLYESAHRSAWRRLKEHLTAGTRPDDLAGFARLTDHYATLTHT